MFIDAFTAFASTVFGGFILTIAILYYVKLLNFYSFSITAALFLAAFIKNNTEVKKRLLNKQTQQLDKVFNSLTFKFIAIISIYLTATYLLDNYLLHNTIKAAAITTTVLLLYYFYIAHRLKKEQNKANKTVDVKEFKKLDIKKVDKNIDEVKHDLYLYSYKYTLDNAIDNIELKNKNIAISLAKEVSKYVRNTTLKNSFVTQQLVKKFEIEAEPDEKLFNVHKKIIKKVYEIYARGGIVRVQQLLQYAKNDEEKAFIYFLAQLGSGKFTQLGARYAIFAIKNQII